MNRKSKFSRALLAFLGITGKMYGFVFGRKPYRLPATHYRTSAESIVYDGVGISATALWQEENRRLLVIIKRDVVQSCELRFGSPEERPMISMVVGVILTVVGIPAWLQLATALFGAGHIYPTLDLALVIFSLIGMWLVMRAVHKRSFYLFVRGKFGTRKLIFQDSVTTENIVEFLNQACEKHHLVYEDKSAEKPN